MILVPDLRFMGHRDTCIIPDAGMTSKPPDRPVTVPLSPVVPTPSRLANGQSPTFLSSPGEVKPPSSFSGDVFLRLAKPYLSPAALDFAQHNTGLLLIAAAQFFLVFMNVTVRYFLSNTGISVLTLISVRMIITAGGCIISLYLMGDPNPILGPPEVRHLLAIRGTAGFLGLLGGYQSFKGLTVSDSMTIQFLAPTITAFLAFVILGETMTPREILAGVFCLLGVLLVSRPPFIFGGHGGEETFPSPDDSGSLPFPDDAGKIGEGMSERMVAVTFASMAVFTTAGACKSNIYRHVSCRSYQSSSSARLDFELTHSTRCHTMPTSVP